MEDFNGVVLDIDDTLSDTSATAMKIMHARFGHALSADDLLKQYGMPGLVPEWLHLQAQNYLQHALNSHDFLASLPPVREAQTALAMLTHQRPVQMYLTSRLSTFKELTTQWLVKHGFPAAPVICRERTVLDLDWKVRFLEANYPNAWGIIDNELYVPENISFHGQLIEMVRHKKLTKEDARVKVFHDWTSLMQILKA